jgi:putative PIG3 family NAD(P)H quinone oxidoreductase
MKAILYSEGCTAEELMIGEIEKPFPSSKQILVKVKAAGINRADIMQRQGKYPPPKGASTILGLEISGIVVKTGSEVTKWKKGDKVFGLLPGGGYAEYAAINEDMAMPIPNNLTMTEAAAIPEVFLTAYQAIIYYGKIKSGDTLLIHAGASGVGTAAIQIAKELNAKIIITASKAKHNACINLGAEKTIDYKTEDFFTEVLNFTNDQGVDVIIDFIGAPYLQRNLNLLKSDGRLIMLSSLGGRIVNELDISRIVGKRLSIIGSALRSRDLFYQTKLVNEFSSFAMEKFATGKFKPVIDKVFNFRNASEAHKFMEENKNIGKIILEF